MLGNIDGQFRRLQRLCIFVTLFIGLFAIIFGIILFVREDVAFAAALFGGIISVVLAVGNLRRLAQHVDH